MSKRQPLLEETGFVKAFIRRQKASTQELPINKRVNERQTLTDLEAILEQNPVKALGWWKADRP